MRAQALAARAGHDATACGIALMTHLLRDWPPRFGATVSGFWPLGDEIDLRPLLTELVTLGHDVVLPVTPKRGEPLGFRLWRPGGPMVPERFGTARPSGDEREPDVLLVPLLAFDRHGHRLGYGGGFYDRTLALRPGRPAIGCAYASQEVDAVPIGPYDIALDAVATERGVIRFGDG
jgi:5-formyltetrahydrofolate cyclo-ligase